MRPSQYAALMPLGLQHPMLPSVTQHLLMLSGYVRYDGDQYDDYDEDEDDEFGPCRKDRNRKGGYNGRTENDLLLLDPKRVKRILANRQSAARSKERRLKYTHQLETRIQQMNQEADRIGREVQALDSRNLALSKDRSDLVSEVRHKRCAVCNDSSSSIKHLLKLLEFCVVDQFA